MAIPAPAYSIISQSLSASPNAAIFSLAIPSLSESNFTPDFFPASLYDISISCLTELVIYISSSTLYNSSIILRLSSSSSSTISILSSSYLCSYIKPVISSLRVLVLLTYSMALGVAPNFTGSSIYSFEA